ncbi:MAG: cyanophycin synthetase [Bacillota bacterium]
MQILEIRPYEGINIYCFRPVIKMKLALGEMAGVLTDELGDFNHRLISSLPSLRDHHCSLGKPGGFVERLIEGTMLGHVVEHVALELQHLAGMDVIYGKTHRAEEPGTYYIIFEYVSKEGAICAARSAVQITGQLLAGGRPDIDEAVRAIRETAVKTDLGPSTKVIAMEALKKGIPVMRLGEGSILQLGYGKHQKKVAATITENTRCIGVDIAGDKVLTKQLLAESGIPVPTGGVARTEQEALNIAREIGAAVVVKPFDGNQGKGVALNLKTAGEIGRAFAVSQQYGDRVIVEKYILGRHYRLLVVGDRMVAAAERIPAFVVGDGKHSIEELVEIVNSDPLRGDGHEKPLTRIRIDQVVLMVLARQHRNLGDVPAPDEIVYLRDNANLSTGGIAVDVTDRVHPDNAEMCMRAVKLIGLDVAGVDLVARDIGKPVRADEGAVIEINAAPGIRMHHYPSKGKPRNVARAIVEKLFPSGAPSRIPIISVTGTNGKTTTTRIIGHILKGAGMNVGMTTTDGIYLRGKMILPGDTTGPASARVVLRDASVDVAVLETARGGLIRAGLGYDYSDVGVITNISPDHLGIDGIETLEDLAKVKSLVGEAVHRDGFTVLNADDRHVAGLVSRMRSRIILFSAAGDNIMVRRHLGAGGTAVFVKNKTVVTACGNKLSKILPVKSIPCTLQGAARHNVENVLAAVAACWALGVSPDIIRDGLLGFSADLSHNPGRMNVWDAGGVRVVVDYGHNPAGYRSVLNTVQKFRHKRLIGVIGVPGDRLDEHILEVGRIAGAGFDRIFIKEDADLRGRAPGETAGLLKQGALASGIQEGQIKVIPSEPEAVREAVGEAVAGDVVVVFYEKIGPVTKIIDEYCRLAGQKEEKITGGSAG